MYGFKLASMHLKDNSQFTLCSELCRAYKTLKLNPLITSLEKQYIT
jgi:hypothetical protein